MFVSFQLVVVQGLMTLSFQVSWGTKGSDKAEALPSVKSTKAKEADAPAVEDTVKAQEDVDAAFKETVTRAITKVKTEEAAEKPTMDDQNKTFRTRLVAFWMLSNATLALAIENLNGLASSDPTADAAHLQKKQNVYFSVILYSTFGLAAVRFVGVCLFLDFWFIPFLIAVHPFLVSVLLLQAQSVQMVPQELSLSLPSVSHLDYSFLPGTLNTVYRVYLAFLTTSFI